jgi:hypothetical protein
MPLPLPDARCALTAPFHPCRLSEDVRRFAFCGAIPGVAPAGRYPAPCFRGARTFLHRGGRAVATAAAQPADRAYVRPRAGAVNCCAQKKKAGPKTRQSSWKGGNGGTALEANKSGTAALRCVKHHIPDRCSNGSAPARCRTRGMRHHANALCLRSSSLLSVSIVEASAIPSTLSWRKWRWKARTTASVRGSNTPLGSIS